jgi:hypothetical protein
MCIKANYDKEVTSVHPRFISKTIKWFLVKFGIRSSAPKALNYFYILIHIGSSHALHETQIENRVFLYQKRPKYTEYCYVACNIDVIKGCTTCTEVIYDGC